MVSRLSFLIESAFFSANLPRLSKNGNKGRAR